MQKSASAFFILAAIATMSATPARAAIEYPWCAQYSGQRHFTAQAQVT
jgi:hypothetical protein